MNTDNPPCPFKTGDRVICVNDDVVNPRVIKPVIGDLYTIVGPCKEFTGNYIIAELPLSKIGNKASYHGRYFAPLPPMYEDITHELAQGVNVGDTADRPVKIIQTQNN